MFMYIRIFGAHQKFPHLFTSALETCRIVVELISTICPANQGFKGDKEVVQRSPPRGSGTMYIYIVMVMHNVCRAPYAVYLFMAF